MKLRLISLAMLALLSFSSCRDKLTGPPTPTLTTSDTIAYWPFNGNTNDVSGNGHNGSISGPASYGNNRFAQAGSALVLDHQTTVVVPSTDDLNMITGNSYTISAWVWYKDTLTLDTGSMGVSGSVLSKMPPKFQNAEETGYEIWPTRYSSAPWGLTYSAGIMNESNNGDQSFGIGGDAGAKQFPIGFNQWHMVTVVLVAHQNISLYIDSVLIESAPYEIDAQAANNDIPLTIGLLSDSSMVDDIIILHSAMSATDVQARFHEGGWFEHAVPVTPLDSGWTQGNFGTTQSIEGISFPIPNIGYACGLGGTLLKSSDSGKTWQAMASGTSQDLYRVSAVEPPNMQAQNFVAVAGGNNGTVLRTTDPGGNTWAPVANVPFQTVNGTLENIRDIKFIDNAHVIMVGGAGSTQTAQADGFVMISSDAGATWTRAKTTSLPLYGIGVSSANLVTVVGNQGEIYSTTDLGNTWTDQSVSDAGDDLSALDYSPVGGNLRAGMAATAYGTLYNTSDGGVGWGTAEQSPVTSALRTVRSLSVGEWWIAGDNGVILHTLNDGLAWTRADISGVTVQWNEIVARDTHTLAFVGANGTLYWYAH